VGAYWEIPGRSAGGSICQGGMGALGVYETLEHWRCGWVHQNLKHRLYFFLEGTGECRTMWCDTALNEWRGGMWALDN
jgi:hypothetical protein